MNLVEKLLKGDEKSAARLISLIENGAEAGFKAVESIFPYTGKAYILGITGPPGAGKSTLIDKIALRFAKENKKIGVIAVDPSSIHNKGAFLGDRVRMKEAEKIGIFIRSMANRGYGGGLAKATIGAVYILEGLGKEIIIIESVGVGQSEKDIFYLADTVISVLSPDFGDDIQLIKAGVVELGDIVVINKADLEGAKEAFRSLSAYITMSNIDNKKSWIPRLFLVSAKDKTGIDGLIDAISEHKKYLEKQSELEELQSKKAKGLILSLLKEILMEKVSEKLINNGTFQQIVDKVIKREIDLYMAANSLIKEILKE